ncbi:MAG: dihydroorotase [Pseudomonadota bacterium]
MPETFDLVLKNGTIATHEGERAGDIGVKDGRIAAIGTFSGEQAGETIDCTGLHILPGVIDTQVHFREPGLEHKEDLETGANAAVMGGVTAVFEMPNTIPQTTSSTALEDKLNRAKGRMSCDYSFFMGGTAENCELLGELEQLPGCCGVKVFMGSSTGSLLVSDDKTLGEILKRIRRRAAFHSEDEDRLNDRKSLRIPGDPTSHPVWRDEETAMKSTQRLVTIAEKHQARIHVLHVTTAQEMAYLAKHKNFASVEVTPHHLTMAAPDCYERLGTYAQMNPPVRDAKHRQALWEAIRNRTVDVLGSDHAPHTREEKDKPYPQSPSGMTGVQTLLPLMLDAVNGGKLSLQRLVELTSDGPRRLYDIKGKGRIAEGYDADFSVVDMKRRQTITNDWIASKCGWTPYDGMKVMGWVTGTVIRGKRVMWEGEILHRGDGKPVQFR